MRRDPEEMGVYALPSALPLEGRKSAPPRELCVHPRARRAAAPPRRTAGRDATPCGALYRRYARSVFGLALRRLGDRMTAEDAVQETFAAIWRSARTYKPERGAGAP